MNFKKGNIVLTLVLSALIIVTLILLFNIRDLPQKPVIDVIITSLSGIISALLAALIAYYVAHIQITYQSQEKKTKRKHRYLSALQLLSHEIQFNKQVLDTAVAQSESGDLKSFLETNIAINTWNQVSLDVIQDLDRSLMNEVSTFYYKITMLKQGFSHAPDFIRQTFSLCVTIEAKINAELEKSNDV